jgi:hypothetical protein
MKKPMMKRSSFIGWVILIGLGILCYLGLAYIGGQAWNALMFGL